MDSSASSRISLSAPTVALLTGGGDKPYALGLSSALAAERIQFDFIGSDDLAAPEVLENRFARFLNLRGDQNPNAPALQKFLRVLRYYWRLLLYAVSSRAPIFHILWHNKFEWFDRTILLLFYRLLGKRLVYTAHNVNTQARDGQDSFLNRLTLKIQYNLIHHTFVHTARMKQEILSVFHVPEQKVSVIPFGINNTTPETSLTGAEARQRLGLSQNDKVLLFFGNVAPYKGLEFLVRAFSRICEKPGNPYRLVIAGRLKCSNDYWEDIQKAIRALPNPEFVIQRIEFIPDSDVEVYFKASDVLVLPYTHIFQSGVLFLGYSFGLPVLAADVGSLKEEIVDGETGYVFHPADAEDLAATIEKLFSSRIYSEPDHRTAIRDYARNQYSWSKVVKITEEIYQKLAPAVQLKGGSE